MLRVISLLVLTILLSLTTNVKGQVNLSGGVESTLMPNRTKSIGSFGYGGSLAVEIGISNKSGFTARTGYIYLNPGDNYAAAHMTPYMAGLKMYFNYKDNGAYFHPHVGIHKVSQTTKSFSTSRFTRPEHTTTNTGVSYGLGLGYITTKNIEIEVRYTLFSGYTEANKYLSLRIAYVLFKRYKADRS